MLQSSKWRLTEVKYVLANANKERSTSQLFELLFKGLCLLRSSSCVVSHIVFLPSQNNESR